MAQPLEITEVRWKDKKPDDLHSLDVYNAIHHHAMALAGDPNNHLTGQRFAEV